MQIKLNYGKSGLDISLPDSWQIDVIEKVEMPVISDPNAALEKAFDSPINSETLDEIIKKDNKKTACILICDITRPVPNSLILNRLIKRLIAAGIDKARITILIATGLHRPNLDEEMIELVGDKWILENIKIVNHYARNDEDHREIGVTKNQTQIAIDKRFLDADLKIVTGLVEPHFMAGYSGGRKVIVPGISHAKTITRIHSHKFMGDMRARNCNLDKNPLHDEQLEIIRKLGDIYAVNVVINENRELCFVSFGEIETSHLEAINYFKQYGEIEISEQYQTVITTSAGYPLDATYYQTVKSMVGAIGALKKGGRMFVASKCNEGLGSVEYIEAQKRLVNLGVDKFLHEISQKKLANIDEWQTQMQTRAMLRGEIYLYTDGLSDEDHELTGVKHAESLEKSVVEWVQKTGDTRVAVIPEGPYVIPKSD